MELDKAIQVIKNIGSAFNGNLAQHQEIQLAIQTIVEELNKKVEKKK